MNETIATSEKKIHPDIICFEFEKEFISNQMKCIPMVVRYKLDTVGIKLTLAQWSRFEPDQRYLLSVLPCVENYEMEYYANYLIRLIELQSTVPPTRLSSGGQAPESGMNIYHLVKEKVYLLGKDLSQRQWTHLSVLERFALSKLIRPGHESKNLLPALIEFGLITR